MRSFRWPICSSVPKEKDGRWSVLFYQGRREWLRTRMATLLSLRERHFLTGASARSRKNLLA